MRRRKRDDARSRLPPEPALKQIDFRRLILDFGDADKVFDPAQVYGPNGDTAET